MYNSNDTEDLMNRNKPKILFPILSSILSVILIGVATYVWIVGQMKWYYALICYVIFIMFALASWYNSYFSKKVNQKKIKNYQEETNIIVNYSKRYKEYTAIKITNNEHIYVTPEINETFYHQKAVYDEKKYSFGSHLEDKILISFGVSFAGLEVDPKKNKLIDVIGVVPKSIWIKKKLVAPIAKEANLYVNYEGFEPNTKVVIQYLKRDDFYYDKKTGWLMVGERKKTPLDEAYKIMDNVIVVIRDKEIVSLWIEIEKNICI